MKLEQLNLEHKKVLVRVDFNVPLDAQFNISDDTRIRGALPTLRYILSQQPSRLILCSHLGRPLKKLKADGSLDVQKFTLQHLVKSLSEHFGQEVIFSPESTGPVAEQIIAQAPQGSIILLENTRFNAAEEKGGEDYAQALAQLAEVYVNDAFGAAHRAHSSTAIIAKYFDNEHKAYGFLMRSELDSAARLLHQAQQPVVAIVGGAKVSDKILLLEKLVEKVQTLIIGGGMAYTFFLAQGAQVGKSLVELDKLETAKALLEKAKQLGVRILLPQDSIIADQFSNEANRQVCSNWEIPSEYMGLDIGPEAVQCFQEAILEAKTIFWNGPMGVFEFANFAQGTMRIAEAVAQATQQGAYSLVGGGDSVAAINQLGKANEVSYVSTGGGAMLELLEGKILPGVAAIEG
jgi:phosphoglycerate kinase